MMRCIAVLFSLAISGGKFHFYRPGLKSNGVIAIANPSMCSHICVGGVYVYMCACMFQFG